MNFSFWLDAARVPAQCGFWAGCFVALWATFGALQFRRRTAGRSFHQAARGLWGASMGAFVGMWVAGAGLEMMRRGVLLTATQLVVALGAFSFLLAGVWNLVREWFDSDGRLLGARVAGTLILLSLAGWWLGGFAGARNPLFQFATGDATPMSNGWALSLAGAQLLGAAHCVGTHPKHPLRVLNPRGATLWLLAFALCLGGANGKAATTALAGFGPFVILIWNTRTRLPTRALKLAWLVAALSVGIGIWLASPATASPGQLWREPLWNWAFGGFLIWALALVTIGRRALKVFVDESSTRGALLKATLFGALVAAHLFGPAGALWWSFWPLAGLFFDSLRFPDDELPVFVDEPFVDERARTDSACVDPAIDRATGIPAGGGRAEKR